MMAATGALIIKQFSQGAEDQILDSELTHEGYQCYASSVSTKCGRNIHLNVKTRGRREWGIGETMNQLCYASSVSAKCGRNIYLNIKTQRAQGFWRKGQMLKC